MGDPAGVGPEICLRLLADAGIAKECVPVVFGDAAVLRRAAEITALPFAPAEISPGDLGQIEQAAVLDLKAIGIDEFQPGQVSAATGRAAFSYVDRAIDAALAGHVVAVSTGPLSKEALFA